jgi:hypothetical protein
MFQQFFQDVDAELEMTCRERSARRIAKLDRMQPGIDRILQAG